mgnify:FL=1
MDSSFGTVAFDPPRTESTGSFPTAIRVADFDGNGVPDIASANAGDHSVRVLLRGEAGQILRQEQITVGEGIGLAAGDVNGDGNMDLLTGSEAGTSFDVLLGHGDGTFERRQQEGVMGPVALALGDLDRDGKLDVAVAELGRNEVSTWRGAGDGTFRKVSGIPVGRAPWSVAIEDVTGDDHPDVVGVARHGSTAFVLPGDSQGGVGEAMSTPVGNSPISISTGDLDHDGKPELAVINAWGNTVSILRNLGAGRFETWQTLSPGNAFGHGVFSDLNGDGHTDLALAQGNLNLETGNASGDGSIAIFPGRGDGTFHEMVRLPSGGLGPVGLTAADLDRNGSPDLLTANTRSGTIGILRNAAVFTAGEPEALPPALVDAVLAEEAVAAGEQPGTSEEQVPFVLPLHDPSLRPELRGDAQLSPEGKLTLSGSGALVIPHGSALEGLGKGPLTLGIRAQFLGPPRESEVLVVKNVGAPLWQGFVLLRRPSGRIVGGINGGSTGVYFVETLRTIEDSAPYDIVLEYSGQTLRILFNGEEQATQVSEGVRGEYDGATGAPLILGRHPTEETYFAQAVLEDLLLLRRTLAA